jgi:hypothetical protein
MDPRFRARQGDVVRCCCCCYPCCHHFVSAVTRAVGCGSVALEKLSAVAVAISLEAQCFLSLIAASNTALVLFCVFGVWPLLLFFFLEITLEEFEAEAVEVGILKLFVLI